MRELLARHGFRRLLVGQSVSSVGDWMATVALMILVLQLSGSATAVAGVLVLRLLPSLVAAPIAARAAAKLGRRRVMLMTDAGRAVCAFALPLIDALWWVYVWAFLIEVGSIVFLPARDSSVPVLAGERRLDIANALVLGTSYGAIPIGAAAFGGVYVLSQEAGLSGQLPFVVVFWINAATFLVSYVAIRGIPLTETEDVTPAESTDAGGFLAGLRLPLVRGVLPAIACVSLGLGALFSVGVSYVEDVLEASPAQFGLLIVAFGVGAATGLATRRTIRAASELDQMRAGAVVQGVTVIVMSVLAVPLLALGGAAVFGLAGTVTLVAAMSFVQTRLTGTERDQAFTAAHVTIRLALVIAAIGAGAAADLAPKVDWGITLLPPQVVLIGSGFVVLFGGMLVRDS